MPGIFPPGLLGAGLFVALFAGWLGGERVTRYGIGVHRGASLDSPSRPR